MHLSLELPEGSDGAARLHAQTLLRDHLQARMPIYGQNQGCNRFAIHKGS